MTTSRLPGVVPADIASALTDLGIGYVIRGDEAVALCPHPEHNDSKPSWSCNLETGLFNCFSCGFSGNFEWLVRIVNGTRKGEAVAWIYTRKPRIAAEPKPLPSLEVSEKDLWEFTPPPQWALDSRGISSEACDVIEILFNLRLDRWVFPLRDPYNDKLIGWQEKGATPETKHLVLNKPVKVKKSQTVFGMKHLKSTGTDGPVVVIENPVKTARFIDAGIPRVVSTCGSAFTVDQVNLLWPYADEIVFALDNDPAGHKAMSRWIKENPYGRSKISVFNYNAEKIRGAYVHKPDGRDPGDLTNDQIVKGYEQRTPSAFTYFDGTDWEN